MDAVIREGLRILAPAPATIRESTQDAVIPLSQPVMDRNGKMLDSIKMKKGVTMFIRTSHHCSCIYHPLTPAILNVNLSEDIWGPDAHKFNPDRYLDIVEKAKDSRNQVPGIWGNLLSFLGGTRNCIGYRFALAEMKAILFVLIRAFAFEELPSKPTVEQKAA